MKRNQLVCVLPMLFLVCHLHAKVRSFQRYLWANYREYGGNLQQAQQWYQDLNLGESVYTYKGYVHLLHKKRDYARIVKLIPKIDQTFINDPELQLILVRALRAQGDGAQANKRLVRLSSQFKANQEIAFETVTMYMQNKELKNALNTIDALLNTSPHKPNNFIFYFLKAQIYYRLNEHQNALKMVKKSIDMHPRFDRGWLLYALIEEQAGNIDAAIKGYTSFLEITGGNDQIAKRLLQLALRKKAQGGNNRVLIFNKSCFDNALLLFQRKEYKQALAQIDRCLIQQPNSTDGKLLKIQILTAMRSFKTAAQHLRQWIMNDPDNELWFTTLHLLRRADAPLALIINTLEAIHHKFPQKHLPLLYLADLHSRAGNNKQALAYGTKALPLITDTKLRARLVFHLATLHYKQQNYASMKTMIEQEQQALNSFAPLLNLLAYYYATKGNNVKKAHFKQNASASPAHNNISCGIAQCY